MPALHVGRRRRQQVPRPHAHRPTCSIRPRSRSSPRSTSSTRARAGGARCRRCRRCAFAALLLAGVFIADRVNKLPMVLAFLGAYFGLFTTRRSSSAPARSPRSSARRMRRRRCSSRSSSSPIRRPRRCCIGNQIVCALIVAGVSFAVFEWVGAAYYLLAGVLAGNVWEAWSRTRIARGRHRAGGKRAAPVSTVLISS